MNNYTDRAEKILQRINALAAITEVPGTITRTLGTSAFIEGSQLVMGWMQEAGLETYIDNIGNVRGRLNSAIPGAKTFVIGSHIDTVMNAGKFDGPLGVLMGLDIIEQVIESKTSLPFNIELIAFSDEEGVRFHTTYLGSKVIAGTFNDELLSAQGILGLTLKQVIEQMGGDVYKLPQDKIEESNWLGYFEIHIEQGPVLYEKNIPVALVTAIAGQKRIEITFSGEAGHAGTVPMNMRNDALCCAAEFILEAERFAKSGNNVVATIGTLQIPHAASNVIPGEVICTLDIRSDNPGSLSACLETVKKTSGQIAQQRNITVQWRVVQETMPVQTDTTLNNLITQSIQQSGHEVVELVSGAGHDAVALATVSPISMLFVRCYKGISHNPKEDVDKKDIAAALEVSGNFIQNLVNHYNK